MQQIFTRIVEKKQQLGAQKTQYDVLHKHLVENHL